MHTKMHGLISRCSPSRSAPPGFGMATSSSQCPHADVCSSLFHMKQSKSINGLNGRPLILCKKPIGRRNAGNFIHDRFSTSDHRLGGAFDSCGQPARDCGLPPPPRRLNRISLKSCSVRSAIGGSRLPVGSSAGSTGPLATARAIATLLLAARVAPGDGPSAPRAERLQKLPRPLLGLLARQTEDGWGSTTFSSAENSGADDGTGRWPPPCRMRSAGCRRACRTDPVDDHGALVEPLNSPAICSSVDLPAPDGPSRATASPG